MTGYVGGAQLAALLDELHARSEAQEAETRAYFERRVKEGTLSWKGMDEESHRHFADKLVALEKDKALFCVQVCRALRARRIVEAGTSFGVSTLYLASAVAEVIAADGGEGVVIGTEHESAKAAAARANFEKAGLAHLIDLREGDLAETLKRIEGPIDFMLLDIWVEAVRPAMELVTPHLRRGAVVVADNTISAAKAYGDYFAFLKEAGFSTQTLPFNGGLEMSVKL